MYAFPVNFTASIFVAIMSIAFEGTGFVGPPNMIIFGWFYNSNYFLYVFLLAAIPGMLGHTMINYVLKHVSALLVSIVLLFEPLVGSLLGYWIGIQGIPGVYTLIGGPILMIGAGMVIVGQNRGKAASTEGDSGEGEGKEKENLNTGKIPSEGGGDHAVSADGVQLKIVTETSATI
jgi:hypothetical protein